MERKYKTDFEDLYLLGNQIPDKWNMIKIDQHKPTILFEASRFYNINNKIINRVGFSKDDIVSIYTVYSAIHFNKGKDELLKNFLRQRGIRLLKNLESKNVGLLETTLIPYYDDEYGGYINFTYPSPEEILLAKETAQIIYNTFDKQLKLLTKTKSNTFYKKHQKILRQSDIQQGSINRIANEFMLDYILKTINDGSNVDLEEFKKYLSSRFSKFLFLVKEK